MLIWNRNIGVSCLHFIRHTILTFHSYRTSNLLLTGLLAGPKEQDPDQVQRYMRIIVNDLLRLWKEGILLPTELQPQGRRVRVILLCVCCDTPAAHKLGGFASHSHTRFCIKCWITQADKGTEAAFTRGGQYKMIVG